VFSLLVPICGGSGGTPDDSLIVDKGSSPSRSRLHDKNGIEISHPDFPELIDLIIDPALEADVAVQVEDMLVIGVSGDPQKH
jgi:hypothetical protein